MLSQPAIIPDGLHGQPYYKVILPGSSDRFLIYFEGSIQNDRIGWQGSFPPRFYIESVDTGDQFLLFDGSLHGYDAVIAGFSRDTPPSDGVFAYTRSPFQVYMSFDYDNTDEIVGGEEYELYQDVLEDNREWLAQQGIHTIAELASCSFTTVSIVLADEAGNLIHILEEETA